MAALAICWTGRDEAVQNNSRAGRPLDLVAAAIWSQVRRHRRTICR